MVRLDRIYTGGGDEGLTSIGSGERVSKLNARIVAGGVVDELNCALGLAAACCDDSSDVSQLLLQLQQFLFDLGADLCTPVSESTTADEDSAAKDRCPRITADHVSRLEQLIDQYVGMLQPLTSFVLPGGTVVAAHLHQARSICRRAELEVLRLAESAAVNRQLLVSLNRLSDLLFVLARAANNHGRIDVLWVPGRSLLHPAP